MLAIFILLFFIISIHQLLGKLNKGYPIFELTVMLYILQYLVAPLFEYKYNTVESMAISEDEYFSLTLFAILALTFGLFSVKSDFSMIQKNVDSSLASNLGRLLVLIGFSSQIVMEFLPYEFRSSINFLILFKNIGVYALIFSDKPLDKLLIIFLAIQIAVSSILGAMLIEFIVFLLFLAMYISIKYEITNQFKYSFFFVTFFFMTVYQGVKGEYREMIWGRNLSFDQKVTALSSLITTESIKNAYRIDIENNESLIETMHRLNQGWQTSKVYKHVPTKVDFESGKEILNDILSSLLPRFLWPDKRTVNDFERFNYYTGYSLNRKTSMSIGVIGDFYLNFGKIGTVIAMFLFGYFIALFKKYFIKNFVNTNLLNLIWLPFLFSYLIRPGNEFYMVLNHLFKASLVLFIVFKFIYVFFQVEAKR